MNAAISLIGTIVACLAFLPLSTRAFAQTGSADSRADQATAAAAPAAATPAAPEAALQEVTVSASAISIAGYQAPTPVTAIGLQQLQSAAQPEIGNVLRQLPQITGTTAQNGATSGDVSDNLGGLNNVNLRNLGINRTLVLFDSQRVVAASNQGGVDSSLIPTSLVERIDVVTGGASATYGSDAIAGVVNLIINKRFNGVEINVMESNNGQNLHRQDRADITLGMPFAGGRGHVEVAGSLWNSPTWANYDTLPGWNSPDLVANPACTGYRAGTLGATCPPGQYIWLNAFGVGLAKATRGGLITSGLNNQPIPLNNIAFGPGGQPYTFNCGNNSVNINCWGGDFNAHPTYPRSGPLKNYTGFGLISFNINDSLSASLQLNYARTSVQTQLNDTRQLGNISIFSGNPYIPPTVQEALTTLNLPGFKMGATLDDPPAESIGGELNTIGDNVYWNHRTLQRGVFTLEGSLGPKWNWNAYYMHGQNSLYETAWSNVALPNLAASLDAVLVTPAMHTAVPSLPVGSITCAANVPLGLLPGGATGNVAKAAIVANATPGCQPFNPMGFNMYSQAAKQYIQGPTYNNMDSDYNVIKEDVASGSVQGVLPFGLPAGPIAAAAGLLYRSEEINGHACGYNCDNVLFHGGNFVDTKGYYNIKEVNAEINVPILKDVFVRDLSFDAAARMSDYSTSGAVETYKFGVVSQLTDWLRFRGSYSYDIRAPDLYELFSLPQSQADTLLDPRTGLSSSNAFRLNEGNPNLQPEDAETRTFGFVFTPVTGMNVSIDWYYIQLTNIISSFNSPVYIAQCIAGVASSCELLYFGHYPDNYCHGPTLNSCPADLPLSDVVAANLNANSETMSGMDFNGDYRAPFMGGAIDFNAALNYTFQNRLTVLGRTNDNLNSLGGVESFYDTRTGPEGGTTTKFHGTVSVTYSQGGWLGTVQTRMIGAAWQATQWIDTNFISNKDNELPFTAYLDLRASYTWDNGVQLYGAIDDVLDRYPPWMFGFQDNSFLSPIRGDVYDGFGRVWRLGLRYRFGGGG